MGARRVAGAPWGGAPCEAVGTDGASGRARGAAQGAGGRPGAALIRRVLFIGSFCRLPSVPGCEAGGRQQPNGADAAPLLLSHLGHRESRLRARPAPTRRPGRVRDVPAAPQGHAPWGGWALRAAPWGVLQEGVPLPSALPQPPSPDTSSLACFLGAGAGLGPCHPPELTHPPKEQCPPALGSAPAPCCTAGWVGAEPRHCHPPGFFQL